jgi:hypothetical protein
MIKRLFELISKWRERRRFTIRCAECKKKFNVKEQSGICPHIPIEQFIYAVDWGAKDGDYSAKVKISKEKDGIFRIENLETIKTPSNVEAKGAEILMQISEGGKTFAQLQTITGFDTFFLEFSLHYFLHLDFSNGKVKFNKSTGIYSFVQTKKL